MLALRDRIVCTVVRVGDGPENEIDLIHELGPPEGKVQASARVEYDDAAVRVTGAWVIDWHPRQAKPRLGRETRS